MLLQSISQQRNDLYVFRPRRRPQQDTAAEERLLSSGVDEQDNSRRPFLDVRFVGNDGSNNWFREQCRTGPSRDLSWPTPIDKGRSNYTSLGRPFCVFCAFLWLSPTSADTRLARLPRLEPARRS